MASITPRRPSETIRKLGSTAFLTLLFALAATGCATSGTNHVYATTRADTSVHDIDGANATSLPPNISIWERVLGLAYDYNTDHLFARIWPRQIIRVIERPSGKILREMELPAILVSAEPIPADLAIRSRDRHLFAVHPDGHSIVELSLFGEYLQRIKFSGLPTAITGLAFDQRRHQLLLLAGQRVYACSLDGQIHRTITLSAAVNSVTLGYNSDNGHLFIPLEDRTTLGEFNSVGMLVHQSKITGENEITALDAGPRSWVRVF